MPLAARLTDHHTCPMMAGNIPHVGGDVDGPGETTVLIGHQPAARKGDSANCDGPAANTPGAKGLGLKDPIVEGSDSVLIGFKKAARIGDHTAHQGVITSGHPKVRIGDTHQAVALLKAGAPLLQPCEKPE